MTETVQDLHDAFVRAVAKSPPSMTKCREIFYQSGMTPKEAGKFLGIHEFYFHRLMNGRLVVSDLRRKIATLPKAARRRPRASTRISLTDAAVRLRVTREHLSRVLHGHRQSQSLLRRFRQLETEATS